MTTDNRTNEQLAERLRQFAESQAMDFDNPHIAMTLEEIADRLTGTITEAQVEAAAKEFERVWDENIDSFDPEQHDAMSYIKTAMRAALVAAQGAAPQAESENAAVARSIRIWTRQVRSELEATAEANIQLGEDYLHGIRSALMQAEDHAARLENDLYGDKPTPVLPSSGVDEEKLAKVIATATYDWSQQRLEFWRKPKNVEPPGDLDTFIARAVIASRAEWLKEQGR